MQAPAKYYHAPPVEHAPHVGNYWSPFCIVLFFQKGGDVKVIENESGTRLLCFGLMHLRKAWIHFLFSTHFYGQISHTGFPYLTRATSLEVKLCIHSSFDRFSKTDTKGKITFRWKQQKTGWIIICCLISLLGHLSFLLSSHINLKKKKGIFKKNICAVDHHHVVPLETDFPDSLWLFVSIVHRILQVF